MRVRIGPDDTRLLSKAVERLERDRKKTPTLSKLMRNYADKGVPVWLWDESREVVRQAVEAAAASNVYAPDELQKVRDIYARKLLPGSKCTGASVDNGGIR